MKLTAHHSEPNFCVAAWESMIVVIWGRVVQLEDLDHLSAAQHELAARHGHFVVLTIIRAGLSTNVPSEVREASQRNLQDFAEVNDGSAMVVESGGFRMIFFRSVLTGVQLVTRSPVKQKVFDTIGEAVHWLLARPRVDPARLASADELAVAVTRLADQYGQPVPAS